MGEQIRPSDMLEDLRCRRHWNQEFCLFKKLLSGGKSRGGGVGGTQCQLWLQSEQLPKTSNKNGAACKTFLDRLCVKHSHCWTRISMSSTEQKEVEVEGGVGVRGGWSSQNMSPIFRSVVSLQTEPKSYWVVRRFMIKSLWIIKSLEMSASKTSGQTPVSVQDHVTRLKAFKVFKFLK